MSHSNANELLLKTRFGSVDGGTCRLPVPYEGSIWDRLFDGVLRRCVTAEICLTESFIKIKHMVGSGSLEIPLDHVIAVHPCSATGGRYWGQDSVLKVLWEKEGKYLCSWLMLGPGKGNAIWWQSEILNLMDPDFARQHLGSQAHCAETIRLHRRNRRLTTLSVGVIVAALFLMIAVMPRLIG